MTSYYELLETSKTSSPDEIAKAYKKAAFKWHPDRNPKNREQAEEMFKKVGQAYEVLKDGNKRSIYDRFGEDGLKNMPPPGAEGGGGFPPGFNPFEMFGGMFGGGGGMPQQQPNRQNEDGRPILHEIKCTLRDIYLGTKRTEHIERSIFCTHCNGTGCHDKQVHNCTTCNGRGVQVMIHQIAPGMVQQATRSCTICKGSGTDITQEQCLVCKGVKKSKETIKIEVEIKKGTKNGQQTVIHGKGNQLEGNNNYGPVVIVVRVEDDPVFTRKDIDLHRKVDISLRRALLGFKMTLEHLDGKTIVIQSDKVISPFSVKKIPRMGFLDAETTLVGDYYIKFNVIFPERFNSKQLKALELVLHKEHNDDVHKEGEASRHYKLEDTVQLPEGSKRFYPDLDESNADEEGPGGPGVQCAQQ
jgi:DnaJ family protein A protein 2